MLNGADNRKVVIAIEVLNHTRACTYVGTWDMVYVSSFPMIDQG